MSRHGQSRRRSWLLVMAVFGLALLPGLQAQNQPPPWTSLPDHWCWKVRVCTGSALVGLCQAQGALCHQGTCGKVPGDGCRWRYTWDCIPSCHDSCRHVIWQEISNDCGPDCELIAYNLCACSCMDLGINSVEGGEYDQCI
jgi:hypothetical protein